MAKIRYYQDNNFKGMPKIFMKDVFYHTEHDMRKHLCSIDVAETYILDNKEYKVDAVQVHNEVGKVFLRDSK